MTLALYLALPVLALLGGGWLALTRPPGPILRSSLQHFAAGVVFAVVAIELLPDMVEEHEPWGVILGFSIGVALMLLLRSLTREEEAADAPGSSMGLVVGVGIDIAIDGLLLGIGFAAGAKVGKLLAVGLTLELLSLGLATAIELVRNGMTRTKTVVNLVLMAMLFVATALAGDLLLHNLKGFWLTVILSFGAAALLYLVTEELLAEAHEDPDTPLASAQFFVGFLALLMLSMFGG
ncbi:MAG: ZIP family metal transporter [Gemmataceae bacterium]